MIDFSDLDNQGFFDGSYYEVCTLIITPSENHSGRTCMYTGVEHSKSGNLTFNNGNTSITLYPESFTIEEKDSTGTYRSIIDESKSETSASLSPKMDTLTVHTIPMSDRLFTAKITKWQ